MLQAARTAAGGSADVDVTVEHEHLALTRFANSYIHQNVASDTDTVTLRIHADGRTAVNTTTATDDAGLAALVERTVAAARLSPGGPGLGRTVRPRATPDAASADPDLATGGAGPEARAEQVKAYVDAVTAAGLTAAGFYRNRLVVTAYANSEGQAVHGTVVEAAIDGIAKTATSDGASRQASRRMSDLDGAALGARAAAKALAVAGPDRDRTRRVRGGPGAHGGQRHPVGPGRLRLQRQGAHRGHLLRQTRGRSSSTPR